MMEWVEGRPLEFGRVGVEMVVVGATRISGAAVEVAAAVIWEVGSECMDSKKTIE
jgi:hypothetical protein